MVKEPTIEKLKRLNQETLELYQLLKDLDEDQLHDTAYGWSIIQVLSHLNMAELGSIMYMKKKMKAGNNLPDYAVLNKIRFMFLKGLLQSSLKWKAPKPVANPKGDYTYNEIKEVWIKTRTIMEKYIKEYPGELLSKAVYKHPFAGRLDLEAAIDSFIYHQRHHIHQIKRIRKKISE